jgi:hypothetical protein
MLDNGARWQTLRHFLDNVQGNFNFDEAWQIKVSAVIQHRLG